MQTRKFRRVYVWELPVRFFHWINALSIVILAITGFIIANPPAILSNREASDIYWFGTVRFIHFATAYVFFFNMILRIYWSFVGNRFSSWRAFWPFNKKMWHNFLHVIKVDVLLANEKKPDIKDISIGHNSVAAISYVILFLLALVQVFTGFGLYSSTASWWLPKMFSWVVPFLGGDFIVRTIHHTTTWLFILFTLIHVYLVFYHDWLEGRGEVSSMFGGYKFVCDERLKQLVEDEEIEAPVDEEAMEIIE
ncbi:Ni/Fe-hydrogenase, b-type cytochrome subunit [Flagellimonas aequoris]|uniref:Ni/Fe-hydrogenase, b-type cytochrome subunit n=1 Tax=Flagellimonas aequoris TaxID=2306997 RepID=A0A418N278_9FLAO|nr:Ni/Fe-hydrogenase, b-type cytochrome subunit [Allomuricauda aequoris]RIV67402.1 Ni/Fe-hydrogenase, b-type cytochrome subunit [Allomuricauda aequoris]TXJ99224.1 Ni/Fe-hydrogenase, b-type cytochrome subunit [Allomuricauda aequoris]